MIPEAKTAAVTRALEKAFGVTEFEDIRPLTAGLSSALIFRIVVRGRPYLLRVITRTDAMADPTRQFTHMQAGAEAGLAPRVWYTSIEDRVCITDFVEAKPFLRTLALERLPLTLRQLHTLPPFAKPLSYLDTLDGFIKRFQSSGILPASATEELFRQFPRVASLYPRNGDEDVSCHNDLKPENYIFDGDRVWLVDWEAAFLNDRYTDLAIVANFIVASAADEDLFLRTYFGEPAGKYRSARFFLMRQIVHMYYVAVFLLIGSAGKPVDPDLTLLGFRDFHNGIWEGRITLVAPETRVQYGLVHMRQLIENMRSPRFEDSVRVVSRV